jgi:hypothetical protein
MGVVRFRGSRLTTGSFGLSSNEQWVVDLFRRSMGLSRLTDYGMGLIWEWTWPR